MKGNNIYLTLRDEAQRTLPFTRFILHRICRIASASIHAFHSLSRHGVNGSTSVHLVVYPPGNEIQHFRGSSVRIYPHHMSSSLKSPAMKSTFPQFSCHCKVLQLPVVSNSRQLIRQISAV